jgi:branched-chain amino acid transport system substrate-binding protein
MKNLGKVFFLFLLAASLIFISGCDSSNKSSQIRIGAIASLTGAAGEQGTNWVQGATLAIEEANAAGTEAVLSVEDDQTQPAKVVSGLNKLIQVNRVQAVIGGTWDFLAEAAFPVAIKNKTMCLM